MIAYNWFDCDKQPQPKVVNVFAGCVVPGGGRSMNLSALESAAVHRVGRGDAR